MSTKDLIISDNYMTEFEVAENGAVIIKQVDALTLTPNTVALSAADLARLLALLAPEPEPSEREIEHARNMVNSHAWTLVDVLRPRASEQDKRLFDALHDALVEQGKLEVAAARAARQTGGE